MSLKPKPFHELLKMEFIIPPYQRGYRWGNEQVEALLDDLQDFIKRYIKKPNSNSELYYCLQPVAVVKDEGAPNRYIVVDGQQRLTTIYLLLHYLRNEEWNYAIYSLSMPSRNVQDSYLKKMDFKDSNLDYSSNIDIFYIRKAYESIVNWFMKDSKRVQDKGAFRKLFAYIPEEDEINRDVRVIWYEIADVTALDAFRRLNYGKIPLTSTELVKALLLQGDDDPTAGEHSKGAAYRRALEWDAMEHTLQNPYIWAMLANQSDNSLSHLGIVLDFVADQLNKEMVNPETNENLFSRKDKMFLDNHDVGDYFNYNVVNEFLRHNGDNAIDIVWDKIRKTFNLISNWYDNRKWYHLIGLLRILSPKRKTRREFVQDIYRLSVDEEDRAIDRPSFTNLLEKQVGKAVQLPTDLTLEVLNYNESKHKPLIIQILKLLNVKEAIDDMTEENRFAFHLFDAFNVTSLEHIHPQNITTEATFDEFTEWVNRRGEDFVKLKDIDFINAAKDNEDPSVESKQADLNDRASQLRQDTTEALKILKKLTVNQKVYSDEQNKTSLDEATKTLDKLFGELSGIKESELHSISNLALVDQPTNSVLQNFFLDRKRDLLMQRHKECNLDHKKGTYAPPATRRVFCKEYCRLSPGDMRLWRKDDRTNYFEAIKDAYNYFIKK